MMKWILAVGGVLVLLAVLANIWPQNAANVFQAVIGPALIGMPDLDKPAIAQGCIVCGFGLVLLGTWHKLPRITRRVTRHIL